MNILSGSIKLPVYEHFAHVAKALASPHRLVLLELLAQGERRVDDLAREAGLTVANTSQHLRTLRHGGIVQSRREGTAIHYRLADERVFRLWQALREVGETQLAEVDVLVRTYHQGRGELEAINAATLQGRLDSEDLVVLDVRPASEYAAAHIPGARSIPSGELATRLSELPSGKTIVAYCRGPYCVLADEAVVLLRERGYRAMRLEDGLPEWRAAGLPIESEGAEYHGDGHGIG